MKNDHYVKIIVEQRAEIDRLRALRSNALTGTLSDSKIAKLTKHWTRDCDNLYIQVQHPGSRRRSWLFRWRDRVTREYRSIGLGPYPTISIDQARELALFYRQQLLDGKDPRKIRDDKKLDILIAMRLVKTVAQATEEWYNQEIAHREPAYRTKILNQLNKYVYPRFGDMPIQKVDTRTILLTIPKAKPDEPDELPLRDLWVEIHPTAKDMLRYLGRIFQYAIDNNFFHGKNPADWQTLLRVLPPADAFYKREPRPSLPYKDLNRFLQAVRTYRDRSVRKTGRTTISLAVELIALLGCRISEVLRAQWKEFDFESMTWNVPPEHRKFGKRKGRVLPRPITKSMLPALKEMQKRRYDQSPDALVFPSDKNGKVIKTSTPSTWINNTLKWKVKITPHGFRSTLRDWMRGETNFNDVLWKIQVDHRTGRDASDDAYGHDMQLERRRVMMELYDEYSSKPVPEPKAGKVFKLSDKRRSA
jgi:integrase